MGSGSTGTRNVADIVLLGDSFGALRPAFTEGRRIVAGLSTAMYLFGVAVYTVSYEAVLHGVEDRVIPAEVLST